MKKIISSILSIWLIVLTMEAQEAVTISGVLLDGETGKGVEAVNVMLQSVDGKMVHGFTLTDARGRYALSCKCQGDSLLIVVSGFNVERMQRVIGCRTQQVDFSVRCKAISIREVVVKPRVVERTGDTVTYNIARFKTAADHSIGDVLRKLPGITIDANGQILYNGLSINKFYVEGMDMFEGKYGIATNNIRARDIETVEILENHQPIKALRESTLPENAALNLRLKESAAGVWGGSLKVGLGYEPVSWNGEAMGMYFGRSFQNLNIYKSNNTGQDVTGELSSHYDRQKDLSSLVGIVRPSSPHIDKQRFLDNRTHLVSTNGICKLADNLNLTANVSYMQDRQEEAGRSVISYYKPDESAWVVEEGTDATMRKNRIDALLKVESNGHAGYVRDQFSVTGEWQESRGEVTLRSEEVKQWLKQPRTAFANRFTVIRKLKGVSVTFHSDVDYATLPATLSVSPCLYPTLFGETDPAMAVSQSLDRKRLRIQNQVRTDLSLHSWSVGIKASVNTELEWLQSALHASGEDPGQPVAPGRQNDIYWRQTDWAVGPSASYKDAAKKIFIYLNCPLGLLRLRVRDRKSATHYESDKLFLRPDITVTKQLLPNLQFSVRASYDEKFAGVGDMCGGLVMTNYRTFSQMSGEPRYKRTWNQGLSFKYSDILRSLFGSLYASCEYSKCNLTNATVYEENFSHIQAIHRPDRSIGYNLQGNLSKYVGFLRTTLTLSGSYSRSWSDLLRQEEVMKTSLEYITTGLKFDTRLSPAVSLGYLLAYAQSRTHAGIKEEFAPIRSIRQNASFNFAFSKNLVWSIIGEYYYNNTVGEGDRTMFFADTKLLYRSKRVEYTLEARNLFAKHNFCTAFYTDATSYVYAYRLRSPCVMFSIGFNL